MEDRRTSTARRRGAAWAAAGLGILAAACGSPSRPDAVDTNPRWATASEPLATLEPTTSFRGLAVGLGGASAIVAFGIDGTMWSSQALGGAAFSPPRRIDVGNPRFARGPALALGSDGTAVAAWEQPDVDHDHGPMLVWASRFSPASSWGGPSLVERRVTTGDQADPVAANLAPVVALSPSGEAAVVWAARDVFASVSSGGGAWSVPETLDVRGSGQAPLPKQLRVQAGPRGRFVAAWTDGPDGRVSWREPGGGWSPAVSFRVGPGRLMDAPRLAADDSGRALVAWQAFVVDANGFLRSEGVFAAAWADGSGWGPLGRLSEPGAEAFVLDAIVDGTGGGAASWFDRADRLWLSRLTVAGAFSPAEVVPGAKPLPSAMAFLPGGDPLVVWSSGPSVFASRKRGTVWSPPDTLQSAAGDPEGVMDRVAVAANARGEALAAWTRYQQASRGVLWTSRFRTP
jgi:hypothetical protein